MMWRVMISAGLLMLSGCGSLAVYEVAHMSAQRCGVVLETEVVNEPLRSRVVTRCGVVR
jgi:hypothetical protein